MAQTFDLSDYMDRSIREMVATALRSSLRSPREAVFLVHQVWRQRRAARLRATAAANGRHVPPFLIASMADRCNLHCAGCYFRAGQTGQAGSSAGEICQTDVTAASDSQKPPLACPSGGRNETLSDQRWGELFQEAETLGISFVLLAGGEPLMNRPVLEAAARERRVIFPVFTNGTLFDDAAIRLFDLSRNLIPVFSLEGGAAATDARRGDGTHARVLAAMDRLRSLGVLLGASITVTSENCREISSPAFVGELAARGCRVIFWVEYVPVSAGTLALAPGASERALLEDRLAECRRLLPGVIILAFPGDERHTGGCLAAGRGFFHINSSGEAEPCPFSPFSDTSLKAASLAEALESPLFRQLRDGGMLLDDHVGGCLLFTKEAEVRALAEPPKH